MKRFFFKNKRILPVLVVIFVSFILALSAVSMLSQYAREVSDQAKVKASYYSFQAQDAIVNALSSYIHKTSVVAGESSTYGDNTTLGEYFRHLEEKEGYDDVFTVRYYKGDTLYTESGVVYAENDPSRTLRAEDWSEAGFVGIYSDVAVVEGQMQLTGFYSPVVDSEVLDGVILYYPRQEIKLVLNKAMPKNPSYFSALCTSDGVAVVGTGALDSAYVISVLRSLSGDKAPVDEVEKLIGNSQSGTVKINVDGEEYLVSVSSDYSTMRNLSVVELYSVNVLSESTFDFIHTIIAIMILFAVLVMGLIGYLVWNRLQITKELFDIETKDRQLNCLNRHGFEVEAEKILARNPSSNFYVISMELRHYKYLVETLGEDVISSLVVFIRKILGKTVGVEEVFGHITEGHFLLLLHNKDRKALTERLKIFAFLCNQYEKKHKFDVLTTLGIYEVDKEDKAQVTQMVDYANEAKNATTGVVALTAGMQINFYSAELRMIRRYNEDMELRMEGALKNNEFQIFMQPKFNLNTGKQDGCEALVRWYDPKKDKYNLPALFMTLFETNGFITKLDRFVYTKVCEYISYSIAQGRTVYPVSVNISRITAIEPGFVDFYSEIKRKYGIRNGLITLEFTESFAYENYETLYTIVEQLHKNGFECSIDDFGCGYSSYRILKSLPMDEIKLDKVFLENGFSAERDKCIFESIIDVAKKLNMKVTQEGVETYEDARRMKEYHCDVIQGYYYARPLPLSDYISFVASSRSHDVKFDK